MTWSSVTFQKIAYLAICLEASAKSDALLASAKKETQKHK